MCSGAVILSRFGDNFNKNTANASISNTLLATFNATNITTFFVSWPNRLTNDKKFPLPTAFLNNQFLAPCRKRAESRPYLINQHRFSCKPSAMFARF